MNGKFVYLIESECGRIKVGSSFTPEIRLATFSVNCPRPLRLIAMWPGSQSDEKAIHRQFRLYRTFNEWFRPEGLFAEFVASKRGVGVPPIPDWPALAWGEVNARGRAKQSLSMKARWADPVWRAEAAERMAWQKARRAAERSSA